jgi:hypothetical protein
MHELTIVLRIISSSGDDDLMRRSGWIISECNHRLVGYACGVMTQGPRYPDDVIIGILFDYLEHAILEPYTRHGRSRRPALTRGPPAHPSVAATPDKH